MEVEIRRVRITDTFNLLLLLNNVVFRRYLRVSSGIGKTFFNPLWFEEPLEQ